MPPGKSYEDDEDEPEGPRSSFETYLAEGDALFRQSECKKALDSYRLALELQPNDKTCLVARSKCYLKLGDLEKALEDAENALLNDKEYNKGLYRKAEALYCMGHFEYALMYYHRGHKLRPELDEFRLGIQKAQEAIDNSIGSAANIKLENKGDLSLFTSEDERISGKKDSGSKNDKTKSKARPKKPKESEQPAPSKRTVKQLLGELYSDKEYFEKLMQDEQFLKSRKDNSIYELVQGGLDYLETRTEFWRQQKPLYARKK